MPVPSHIDLEKDLFVVMMNGVMPPLPLRGSHHPLIYYRLKRDEIPEWMARDFEGREFLATERLHTHAGIERVTRSQFCNASEIVVGTIDGIIEHLCDKLKRAAATRCDSPGELTMLDPDEYRLYQDQLKTVLHGLPAVSLPWNGPLRPEQAVEIIKGSLEYVPTLELNHDGESKSGRGPDPERPGDVPEEAGPGGSVGDDQGTADPVDGPAPE